MRKRSLGSLLATRSLGFPRRVPALVLAFAGLAAGWMTTPVARAEPPAPAASTPVKPESADYMRVRESDDGATVELQIAAKTLVPSDPKLPKIRLVGVAHIGDKSYYAALQEYLDAQDLVLYEGVKPPGSDAGSAKADGKPAELTDDQRVEKTKRRLRLLAVLAERYRRDHKDIPESIDAMIQGLGGPAKKMAKAVVNDGWDRPFTYVPAPAQEPVDGKTPRRSFDFVSLGADGAAGGEGAAADLKFSMQDPLTKDEKTGGGGMQENLAHSLGLEFQLLAIDYDRAHWRNSDMSFDQVQRDLAELHASGDMLFKMLDGSSISAKFVNIILSIIRASPAMAANAKVMLVETMANADALMDRGGAAGGEQMGALMKVIVEHRNDAVIADLKSALAEKTEKPRESIALFYGAGHLPDMRQKIEAMGYTLDESQDKWFNAIRVSAAESGIPPQQIKMMRDMIRRSMSMQPVQATPAKASEPEATGK